MPILNVVCLFGREEGNLKKIGAILAQVTTANKKVELFYICN